MKLMICAVFASSVAVLALLYNRRKLFVIGTMMLILLLPFAMAIPVSDVREADEASVKWQGSQQIEGVKKEQAGIVIPGIEKMVFKSGETKQKVNLYNPEENNCSIRFTLFINGKQMWQSGKCEPGYGYYEIELQELLKAGTYDGMLLHECFRGETKLNAANMDVIVVSQ